MLNRINSVFYSTGYTELPNSIAMIFYYKDNERPKHDVFESYILMDSDTFHEILAWRTLVQQGLRFELENAWNIKDDTWTMMGQIKQEHEFRIKRRMEDQASKVTVAEHRRLLIRRINEIDPEPLTDVQTLLKLKDFSTDILERTAKASVFPNQINKLAGDALSLKVYFEQNISKECINGFP